jgi:hypothetical protein
MLTAFAQTILFLRANPEEHQAKYNYTRVQPLLDVPRNVTFHSAVVACLTLAMQGISHLACGSTGKQFMQLHETGDGIAIKGNAPADKDASSLKKSRSNLGLILV